MNAIEVSTLTKEFGDFKAVDNISFNVEEGEIFGFLGPNGAGKSTTMMILTTLLKPTSGQALVGGHNVVSDAKRVREKIGYVQKEISVDEFLTGRENLYLHIREYAMDGDTGQWFPTKSGFALPADEVCSLLPLLEDAAKEVSKRFVYSTQFEFEFGEINER